MPAPISPTTGRSTPVAALGTAARQWAEGFNFNSRTAVGRLDVSPSKAPTTGPDSLQRAYALYSSWEDNDLGSVRLLKTTINNQPVYALHTTTDGDDGFLELHSEKGALLATGTTGLDAAGRRTVTWDATPGAVRAQVAPRGVSPSVEAFNQAIADAQMSGSASGSTISKTELRDAARALVGSELTIASVDGWEKAALLHVLADPTTRLTSASRADAQELAALYTPAANTTLTRLSTAPLGQTSSFTRGAQRASATVNASGAPPRLNTMIELSRRAFEGALPAQVVPVTRSEAQAMLRSAGASSSEAKAAVDGLADSKGLVYAGRFFEQGTDWVPKATGLAFFGVSSSGRELKALHVPQVAAPPVGPVPREVIQGLLGVDVPVEVVATRTTSSGTQFDLAWSAPSGGRLEAIVTVPRDGAEPTVENLRLPSVLVAAGLSLNERLTTALGAPQTVLGSGSIPSATVGILAAHRPTSGGPITLSTIHVASGGATATVRPKALGTSATDLDAARQAALGIARAHAETMVEDPSISDAARLEVALRTRWATFDSLERVDPADSAVGFDTTTDRVQFMLPRVWGDTAVFVTFQKNGTVRVEDFN